MSDGAPARVAGNRGNAATLPKGRRKGAKNKTTVAAKEAFSLAFEKLGGVDKLVEWAQDQPTEFYKLFSRLIPHDVKVSGGIAVSWPVPRHKLEAPRDV